MARLPRDHRKLAHHGKFSGDIFKDPIGQKGTVFVFIQIVDKAKWQEQGLVCGGWRLDLGPLYQR